MRWRWSTAGLIALNVAAMGVIGAQLTSVTTVHTLVDVAARPTAVPSLDFGNSTTHADLSTFTNEAMFHESRRFVVAADPSAVVQAPPDYRLAGSMTLPGREPTAILLHNSTGARARVAKGEQLEGWDIAAVNAREVLLIRDSREVRIDRTTRANVAAVPPQSAQLPASSGMRRVGAEKAATPPPNERRVVMDAPRVSAPIADRAEEARLYRPPPTQ